MPKDPEAYLVRGQLYLSQKEWAKCATISVAPRTTASKTIRRCARRIRIDLANCLARAGRYTDAETTLVSASASAQGYRSELWTRLGEVRIALGKLDEAIDALTAALDVDQMNALARWLLVAPIARAAAD